MPRGRGEKDVVSLFRGLITEASDLSFPENATTDEKNFLLDTGGLIRQRRKGWAFRASTVTGSLSEVDVDNVVYWQEPDILLVVTHDSTGTILRLYNPDTLAELGTLSVSSNKVETQLAENTNVVVLTTSDADRPILLEYEKQSTRVQIYQVDISIRDFELVDDGLALSERPSTLSDNHNYNLNNAGWYKFRRFEYVSKQPVRDPITSFFDDDFGGVGVDTEVYPSNADIVAVGISFNENGVETFRPDVVKNASLGNSEAPRGHYIFSINEIDEPGTNRTSKLFDRQNDGSTSTSLSLLGSILL